MANKYILKSIDDNEDELAATVTYEFQAEYLHNILEHIATFLKASGFTLQGLETVDEDNDVDRTEPEDDVEEEEEEEEEEATDTKN